MSESLSESIWLSVVVPLRDESDSLIPLHRELDAALAFETRGIEFIFVDDGSEDDSVAILERLSEKDSRIRVLQLDGHYGQAAALAAGFSAARGQVIGTLDADLQNDPADLPMLLEHYGESDACPDVVNGVRVDRRDAFVRRWSSRVANAVRNRVLGEQVTDIGCSLRVMRASMAKSIRLDRGLHRFLPTLLRLEGAVIIEVPVRHRPRRYGTSKYGIGNRLWVGVVDLLAVRWMQSRRQRVVAVECKPLRRDG